jgi:hypothetical protein
LVSQTKSGPLRAFEEEILRRMFGAEKKSVEKLP